MSTNPESKGAKKGAPPPDIVDEQTGVYGWFRRNQKKLLYSVGLFVLVTFSVSGPMMAAVADWFEPKRPMPSIQVGAERVTLQPTDYDVGQDIANRLSALSSVVPMVNVGEGGRSDAAEVYAWLRRAAITEGLDVSMIEVDRAIAAMMESGAVPSATQLARQRGFASLADFERLVGEALRIGTLLNLQTLALDNSEARILDKVIGDREKVTFKVATFDEAARSEELKAAGGITDEDLKAWLETKDAGEKKRLDVFDTNRVALNIGGLMLSEFDRTEWEDEHLKDFTVGDEERKRFYDMNKERFKKEDGTFRALEDEDVKAELTQLLEAQKVLQGLLGKLNERRNEWNKAANEEFQKSNSEFFAAQNEQMAAKKAVDDGPAEELEAAKEKLRLAEEKLTALQTAKDLAKTAMDARFAEFDFPAAFAELTVGKKGVVQRAFSELRNAKQLEDLEANDLGLGQWKQASFATYLSRKGDLSSMPAFTEKAAILYQVSNVEVQPYKAWEDLKPLLEGAYFNEKAKTEAEAAKQKLEDALLRLAKEKMADKVTEIEGKRETRVDEAVAKWESDTNTDLADARDKLAKTNPGTQARLAWEQRVTELEGRLTKKEEQKMAIQSEIDTAITDEIGEAAKKFHGEVLEAAAAEAGFAVTTVGPLPRDLQSRPRFDKKYDETTVYLFRNHSELEEDESTGVQQDVTERRWHVAVCTGVAPLGPEDIERREFEQARKGFFQSFAGDQAFTAFQQAFTKEALEQRYDVKRPAGEQSMPQPEDGKTGDGKTVETPGTPGGGK